MNEKPEALALSQLLLLHADSITDSGVKDMVINSATELAVLHAENEALRRGNERYRWLRENARVWPSDKAVWADNQIGAAALWIKESVDWTDDASIDAAIDAAMGEKR